MNITQYRNLHKGERAFIIGTGPSLAIDDLESIAAEKSIAMNRISLIYRWTSWRPTYFLATTVAVSQRGRNPEDFTANFEEGIPSFIAKRHQNYTNGYKNIVYLKRLNEEAEPDPGLWVDDLTRGISVTMGTILAALQLAVWMGFTTIYLLGVDNRWKLHEKNSPDPNHFSPQYSRNPYSRVRSDDTGAARAKRQETTLKVIAKPNLDRLGIAVYNVTPGSALDVFPRAELREVVR